MILDDNLQEEISPQRRPQWIIFCWRFSKPFFWWTVRLPLAKDAKVSINRLIDYGFNLIVSGSGQILYKMWLFKKKFKLNFPVNDILKIFQNLSITGKSLKALSAAKLVSNSTRFSLFRKTCYKWKHCKILQ